MSFIVNILTLLFTWLFALVVSWQILALVDFAYPVAYQLLSIDQTILQFAPVNEFKSLFERTDSAEHYRLFAQINHCVHNSGSGLAEIQYFIDGVMVDSLLHQAEIIHLQDVANLIDKLRWFGLILLLGLLVCYVGQTQLRYRLWSLKQFNLNLVIIIGLVGLALAVFGAEKIFYDLHLLVFPPQHQWYFYYEQSLMSTLMQAPNLFGFIGALIVICALPIWWGLLVLLIKRKNQRGLGYE